MRINITRKKYENYLAVTLVSLVLIAISTVAWISALMIASIPLFAAITAVIVLLFIPYSWAIKKIT